ncbi:MAG: hypothetical protein AAFU60_17755 [Bacteroidota bacterium]
MFRILGLSGTILLLIMAVFHGSGLPYVNEIMMESNAASFLKDIFPILFVQPSLHLLTLAAFAGLGVFFIPDGRRVLKLTALAILVDAILALVLQAWIPAGMLVLAAGLLMVATFYYQAK